MPPTDPSSWDERYRVDPSPWGDAPARTIRTYLDDAVPGTAVDLACGDGRHAAWLHSKGWKVAAVDFSPVALESARDRYGTDIDWRLGDVTTWEPAQAVDLVLVGFLQIPATDLVRTLRRATSWLADGGRLFYLGHARENYERGVGGPPDPDVMPSITDLAEAAGGLRVDALQHVLRDTDRGTAIDIVLDVRRW
ncbi:class I SAM-dependent methyltransferase [Saccharomonospora iraqiensis]|uniref:class I SAM-dependent methyltransferase n=1 Tax=Saccharomonospora iraqiensis TaxID=52698 RepID=UPI000409C218|nr:class I SAM-dependent methyltransferase [Saccharomonospora iraqiensis]